MPRHRPADPAEPAQAARPRARPQARPVRLVSWLPYLIALAGAGVGLSYAWQGSRHARPGTALVGGALLAAAMARLLLPPRYAGPLTSRSRAHDVAAFAVFGTAVLALALMLP